MKLRQYNGEGELKLSPDFVWYLRKICNEKNIINSR